MNQVKKKNHNSNLGFTLIELIVVIVIIGILASLVIANVVGVRQRARDGQRKSDLRQIQAALELYRADNGNYPILGTVLPNCPSTGPTFFGNASCNVTYLQKVPIDPTSAAPYIVNLVAGGGTYTLIACLENSADPQRDAENNVNCTGNSRSFTLKNP